MFLAVGHVSEVVDTWRMHLWWWRTTRFWDASYNTYLCLEGSVPEWWACFTFTACIVHKWSANIVCVRMWVYWKLSLYSPPCWWQLSCAWVVSSVGGTFTSCVVGRVLTSCVVGGVFTSLWWVTVTSCVVDKWQSLSVWLVDGTVTSCVVDGWHSHFLCWVFLITPVEGLASLVQPPAYAADVSPWW